MFDNICCIFGKHKYETIQKFSDQTRRIGCPICKKEWAMSDDTITLLPWDFEFQSMYRNIFGYTIQNPRWYKQ
jgi:hypothetical protein